jgi:hypothetical protein
MDFISGEKIQQVCDVYCGNDFHLNRNPIIQRQREKHCNLDTLHTEFNNPSLVFCYSQCLETLATKLHLFKNPFVLVSHNEDTNITDKFIPLADSPKIIQWFAQNLMIVHPKVHFLPIGMANSMWRHGNLDHIEMFAEHSKMIEKDTLFFFNFRVQTNASARTECVRALTTKGIPFTPEIPYELYLQELAKCKYIICPDGNGIDCHRIWEAYAVGTIPILLRNTFSMHLQSILPCILLDSWDQLNIPQCVVEYGSLKSKLDKNYRFCKFSTYKDRIMRAVEHITAPTTSLNNVFCFVGKLPSYAYDTVHQLRLFDDSPIYFIVSTPTDPLALTLKNKFSVTIIPYAYVVDEQFVSMIQATYNKFCIVHTLKGRENLFIHCFERFYLLSNLMKKYQLHHVFFIELDNLIYANPSEWLPMFSRKEMAFMFDNKDRYASGICYFRGTRLLDAFLEVCNEYILSTNEFMSEMYALYRMRQKYPDEVQMLPILWDTGEYPLDVHEHFVDYGETIFDSAAIGIYLGGMDPHHTFGVIQKGLKTRWGMLDYTKFKYEWQPDTHGRLIPHIWNGSKWVRINNLHIHSKDLAPCLSVPIELA